MGDSLMNREEWLLTIEELEKLQEYQEPNNQSLGYERNIAQAQLDKVLNQLWLDKPDCGGWWWFQPPQYSSHMRPGFFYLLNPSYIRINEVSVCIENFPKGKWQKASVPKTSKES